MNRILSEAAQAAKLIRKELKEAFPHIKFKVRSSNFANGDDVNIHWQNGITTKQVQEIINKYEMGHFDGMTDMYEYSNSRDDIPQTKYVMVGRTITDEIYEEAFKHAKNYYHCLQNCKKSDDYINTPQGGGTARWFLWRKLNQLDLTNGFNFEQLKAAI